MKSAQPETILVVDDEEVIRDVLGTLLERRGHFEVHLARDGQEAAKILASTPVDLVLLDLMLPGEDGLEILARIKSDDPMREVIMMTAHGSVETAVEAMKGGAFHYLTKPFQNEEVILLAEKALTQRRLTLENIGLRRALADQHRWNRFVGRSPAMRALYRTIEQVAPARTTVLISGESGTGKELAAEAIHRGGEFPEAPFLVVNSSNIPSELLESQLFGHAKGAFTGASSDRKGLFEAAAGGTLFFDEISTIPIAVQAKLLRVLQEKEFLPLGSVKAVKVDVRIIAASNDDLSELVNRGEFREDLYYRLNVLRIVLPALRDRKEDIPLLVEHFLAQLGDEHGRPGLRLTPEAMNMLVRAAWPGNVRELRNTIERMVLLSAEEELGVDLVPEELSRVRRTDRRQPLPAGLSFAAAVESYERSLIRWALEECGGVQRRAAELLEVKPTTLSERMKRLGFR